MATEVRAHTSQDTEFENLTSLAFVVFPRQFAESTKQSQAVAMDLD